MKNRQKYKLNKKFVQNHIILQREKRFWTKINQKWQNFQINKQGLRANGVILPLALRPGLVLGVGMLPVIIVLGLISLGGIFVGFFSGQDVSASSVTLTIPANALSLDIAPGSGAVFKKSSAGTISVSTDSSYGYSLSIASKTNNDLINIWSKLLILQPPL